MTSGNDRRLPVLIIPGFMSSGLEIRKSPQKFWEGKRLWLNISAAGFNSLHVGGALRKNEETRSLRKIKPVERRRSVRDALAPQAAMGGEDEPAAPIDPASDEMHQVYIKQMECKSKWLWHMRLKSDMIREREGVEVRPIPGTAGVDYLAPGALTESMSYVFGPVLKLLKGKGYKDGVDLDAAPYDWRIPRNAALSAFCSMFYATAKPSELERRDRYFTNTMEKIERLYKNSNQTAVVLLCHSMGCKTGHYLLNFVLHKMGKVDGQAWIDRYVHTYVPVGAPHIGAQKSIRATIDGDKMGLEAFLDDNEGLLLGRSLGSSPWLFPLESASDPAPQDSLPKPPALPSAIVRDESALRIILPAQTLNLEAFLHNRSKNLPSKLRLAIKVGDDVTVRTDFMPTYRGGSKKISLRVNFNDSAWLIACPPTLERTLKLYPSAEVRLEEPGAGPPPKQRRTIFDCDIFWPLRCAWCLFKWIFCCPCTLAKRVGCLVLTTVKRTADLGAAGLGATRVIGKTGKVDWRKGLLDSHKKTSGDGGEGGVDAYQLWTQITPTGNVRHGFFLEKPDPEKLQIKVRWERDNSATKQSGVVCQKYLERNAKYGDVSYSSCNGIDLIEREGLQTSVQLVKNTYQTDPMAPLSLSSWQAPPVKRVVAIYGINLTTEVSGAYRRNPAGVRISSAESNLEQLFVLDKEAKLSNKGRETHVMDDGVICETKDTPQAIVGGRGGIQKKSGDGTVAYWSLQHCRAWEGTCDVRVHEIDGAEHRAILNDGRFHGLLLQLLGCNSNVAIVVRN
ncbi:hypothetical protein ACHAWF_008940 [Thalassiosira exigua]